MQLKSREQIWCVLFGFRLDRIGGDESDELNWMDGRMESSCRASAAEVTMVMILMRVRTTKAMTKRETAGTYLFVLSITFRLQLVSSSISNEHSMNVMGGFVLLLMFAPGDWLVR